MKATPMVNEAAVSGAWPLAVNQPVAFVVRVPTCVPFTSTVTWVEGMGALVVVVRRPKSVTLLPTRAGLGVRLNCTVVEVMVVGITPFGG